MKTTAGREGLRRLATVTISLMAGFTGLACSSTEGVAPDDTGAATPTTAAPVSVNDVRAELGEPVEVAGLTTSVQQIRRQKAVGPSDDAGYIVASVSVANNSNSAREYHRLQFRLRKPDGTSIHRTPVAGMNQLSNGTLEPGQQVSGELVFLVEQAAGRFAVIFAPLQAGGADTKRAVWEFDSQPGEAQ